MRHIFITFIVLVMSIQFAYAMIDCWRLDRLENPTAIQYVEGNHTQTWVYLWPQMVGQGGEQDDARPLGQQNVVLDLFVEQLNTIEAVPPIVNDQPRIHTEDGEVIDGHVMPAWLCNGRRRVILDIPANHNAQDRQLLMAFFDQLVDDWQLGDAAEMQGELNNHDVDLIMRERPIGFLPFLRQVFAICATFWCGGCGQ